MLTTNKGLISVSTSRARWAATLLVLALAAALGACGNGSGTSSQILPLSVTGNWQFTMAEQLNSDPTKPSFTGGLQGGFLVQNDSTVFGQTTFSILTQPPFGSGGTPTQCNSGIAVISGTFSGQSVNLTASSVGQQTYTLTGTLSFDGSTMTGTYTSTDGGGCGLAATQNWSASFVPELTSTSVQGIFHSTGGSAGLNEQDFLVTGALYQGTNVGTSSAAITGNLNFSASGYPCFGNATVSGEISGASVFLELGAGNATVGQVGQLTSSPGVGLQPVTVVTSGNGVVLQSLNGTGYAAFAPGCGGGTLQAPADFGSVCLAVTSTSSCQLPLTVSVGYLTFPAQAVGSSKTTQAFTLSNPSSSAIIDGVTISLVNKGSEPDFSENDNCGPGGAASQGQAFTLLPAQICTISIGYTPKENCPAGSSSSQCLSATVSVASAALQTIIAVSVTGAVSGGDAASANRLESESQELRSTNWVQDRWFDDLAVRRPSYRATPGKANSQNLENHAEIE